MNLLWMAKFQHKHWVCQSQHTNWSITICCLCCSLFPKGAGKLHYLTLKMPTHSWVDRCGLSEHDKWCCREEVVIDDTWHCNNQPWYYNNQHEGKPMPSLLNWQWIYAIVERHPGWLSQLSLLSVGAPCLPALEKIYSLLKQISLFKLVSLCFVWSIRMVFSRPLERHFRFMTAPCILRAFPCLPDSGPSHYALLHVCGTIGPTK
jgi:hypothetical protein